MYRNVLFIKLQNFIIHHHYNQQRKVSFTMPTHYYHDTFMKIKNKQTIILIFLLVSFLFNANAQTITGTVSDTLNKPLESANVIAISSDKNAQLKFAIADNKGRYRLELDASFRYEVTVSYIGYLDSVLIVEANSTLTTHNFRLTPTGEKLKEIIIKHDYKPIVVKKDTLIYDVKSFVNGNERKMKEVLEKLPGVAVDKKGNVTVQGKKVTQMLVENKSFFGGGSKLAVENIPADAIEKIEVIDHFNKVGFLKKVSDSDELAMNVKLKANKKKFVFGDLEAGLPVAFSKQHLLHAALFYYTPKTNLSFIGDANTIGKSTFTFEDLMRFDGGVSSFLSGRKSLSNLYEFTNDNTDVVRNKSEFAALNFSIDVSPKVAISGYGLLSNIFLESNIVSRIDYLQSSGTVYETRNQNDQNKAMLGIGNLKLDYSPSRTEKWNYNLQYQASNNRFDNKIISFTNGTASNFDLIKNANNFSFKQFAEWHKSFNDKHTTTIVVNAALEQETPTNQWLTNTPFLSGLLPLQNDSSYNINQIKKTNNNNIDFLVKHYWIINNFNHLYTNVGNNFINSGFQTAEKQLLSSGLVNDFGNAGFNNNVSYRLNDAYVGLEYKFKIGRWINKPGIYVHQYNLKTNQENKHCVVSKTLLQPQWDSEFQFSQSESITFKYKLANDFPDVNKLSNRFLLQNFNMVYKGNALLQNQQYHNAVFRYSRMNSYRGIMIFANASFNKKTTTLRDEVNFIGINSFSTPILTRNPETMIRISGNVNKKINKIRVGVTTSWSQFDYVQRINNIEIRNSRINQDFGFEFKTAYNKWPDFSVGYTIGFSFFSGISDSKFNSDAITSSFEHTILKNWTFKADYDYLQNTNNNNQSNTFATSSASLRYQRKNNPFAFQIQANNLFDAEAKNAYSFSDFMISEQKIFILPRIIMLSVQYKL